MRKFMVLALIALAVPQIVQAKVMVARDPAPQKPQAVQKPQIPVIAHQRYTLPNGLQVILAPDKSVPLVAVNVWYHVGSGDEVLTKSGFAHLFEHMMFQGAKHIGEDVHFNILKKIGVSAVNGTTNTDRTNYFETVPAHQLETALWLESDRMGYLLDLLNLKSLDNQREVVRNERRQRYDNVPYGKERFVMSALLYPEGHPYRYMTIGLHEDLANASLEDVRAFFQKWYVPANATLCLAGDFEVPAAKKLIAKWFGTFPQSIAPPRQKVVTPVLTENKMETVPDSFARLRRLHYAWHTPASYAQGDAELDLLANALGNAGTGRLYKTLVHEKQLASTVSVYQAGAQLSSTFNVVVELKPNADLAQVQFLVENELDAVMKGPISQRERDRAVTEVETSFIWGLEDLMARAEVLQGYNHYLGAPDGIAKDLARYRSASPGTILQTAQDYLAKTKRVETLTMPAPAKVDAPAAPSPLGGAK